jgi:hypothetical protein
MTHDEQQMTLVNQMVEVSLPTPDKFLIIRETLTRIGVVEDNIEPTLIQVCHILHKRGRYFITHYKELFALDGKPCGLEADDVGHRDQIVALLADWKLIVIVGGLTPTTITPVKNLKIIPYHEKCEWKLNAKYQLGHKKEIRA